MAVFLKLFLLFWTHFPNVESHLIPKTIQLVLLDSTDELQLNTHVANSTIKNTNCSQTPLLAQKQQN